MKNILPGKTNRRYLITSCLVLILCLQGCAASRSKPLPEFATLAITAVSEPANGIRAKSDNDSLKAGAGVGAAGGVTAGLVTSLFCGPWFAFCAPFLVTGGAAAGGMAGGLTGGISDAAFQSLNGEQAAETKAILEGIQERRDLFVEMRREVAAATPVNRTADLQTASAVIAVGPHSIELVQDRRSHLALRMTGVMSVQWDRQRRNPRTTTRRYVHETAEFPVEYWLAKNGAKFDQSFTECIDKLTEAMLWDLRATNAPVHATIAASK